MTSPASESDADESTKSSVVYVSISKNSKSGTSGMPFSRTAPPAIQRLMAKRLNERTEDDSYEFIVGLGDHLAGQVFPENQKEPRLPRALLDFANDYKKDKDGIKFAGLHGSQAESNPSAVALKVKDNAALGRLFDICDAQGIELHDPRQITQSQLSKTGMIEMAEGASGGRVRGGHLHWRRREHTRVNDSGESAGQSGGADR